MAISLAQPLWLLLLLALPLLWVLPRPLKDTTQGLLRSALLLLLALALARPVALSEREEAWRVLVVDHGPALPRAERTELPTEVRQQLELLDPAEGRGLLIEVGGEPLELDAETTDRLALRERVPPARDGLAAALRLAARRIPAGAPASVSVVSALEISERDAALALQRLEERGIPVHLKALRRNEPDLRVLSVTPPPEVRVGELCELRVAVAGRGRGDLLLLGPQGELDSREGVDFTGRDEITLRFEPEEAGWMRIHCALRPAAVDLDPTNDVYTTVLPVQDPLRLRYLGSRMQGASEELQRLLGPGWKVMDRDFEGLPDVVMLDDIPAESLDESRQRALMGAVTTEGVGLFMTGGRAAFGPGGWQEAPLAECLPVELVQKEEKRDPSTTLVVIIDTSGSMSGTRVQLAKEVARLAIRRLLPHDKVGIVEFYGAKRWCAPIQPASNAIDLQRALNRLDAGGGTVILPAIEEAFYGLQNVRTRYKHVLVLTDGGVETGAFEPLLRRMSSEGMTVSTVLVGGSTHSDFLVDLANWGKGRFYSVPNRFNLPEVIVKQPSSARLPGYREGNHPVRARGSRAWWGGSLPTEVPDLLGYAETRARPGADVLLETRETSHPLLSTWQWGRGRVTTFMTEPVGEGTAKWREWENYGAFLARALLRTATSTRPFRWTVREAPHGATWVEAHRQGGPTDLRPELAAVADEGEAKVAMQRITPDRWRAELWPATGEDARYLGRIAGLEATPIRLVKRAAWTGDASRTDPRDRLRAESVLALGGVRIEEETSREELAASAGRAPRRLVDLAPYCLLVALLAFVAEIAWRRRPSGHGVA